MKNIGIDIGGTFIKAAIVETNGKIVISSKTPTPKNGREVPEKVVEIAKDLLNKASLTTDGVKSIGMGAPGVCDARNGRIVNCPNIPECRNIDICRHVEAGLGIPAYVDNDANCAALGEYMLLGRDKGDMVFVTLGTGVGGGIILGGRLLRGINNAAGEIGHIVIVKDGEQCNCGRRGCWERYAAVSALVRQGKAANLPGEVTGKTIFREMKKGNAQAREVVDKWLGYVAEGICDMVNIFQPDSVVIGGGISREGDLILDKVKKYVDENTFSGADDSRATRVMISKLFNDAGVVGASFLYTQK